MFLESICFFLLQIVGKCYYKTRRFYCKMRQVLQNASIITKRGSTQLRGQTILSCYKVVKLKNDKTFLTREGGGRVHLRKKTHTGRIDPKGMFLRLVKCTVRVRLQYFSL